MIGKSANDLDTEEKRDWIKVDQLKPATSGHNLIGANVVLQKERQNGYHQILCRSISECLVGDETGKILFTARNDQGNPIIIRRWEMEESIDELEFNLLPFWIQIHGLPRCMFTVKNAIKIGNSLGKLVNYEGVDENGPLLSFMRLRVEVDVNLSLRMGFNVIGEGGQQRWISLKYERLEAFCFNCGKLGHIKDECYNRNDSTVVYNGNLRTTGGQNCLKMSSMIGKSENNSDTEEEIDWIKVDQLKPATRGHNLIVKGVSARVVLQNKRQNGYHQIRHPSISDCLVGDETGTILFTARNDPVDTMKTDSTLILRNANIHMFKGTMRLVVGKRGQVEVTEPANFTVKEDINLSLVEYELVIMKNEILQSLEFMRLYKQRDYKFVSS